MTPLDKINLLDPGIFLGYLALFFLIVFIRYLSISGVYHYVFFVLFRRKYQHRILDTKKFQKQQLLKELMWSALSSLIFALIGLGSIILWQQGHTAVYLDLNSYPLWYIPISILLLLLIHDTYYYWIHRWMHRPKVLRYLHMVHHDSIHTSALTSFSFHPIESFLQAIVIPLIIVFLPIHIYAVLLVLLVMTLSATINHAGVEVYPAVWGKNWFGKWLIGATHHDLHHKKFQYNYGLYFTFWDKIMGTESPRYDEHFEQITKKKQD